MNNSTSGHSDILVVGGGVIGLACAYYLARAGQSVRIIEQESMGAGASHGNCGLIFVSDLPPLCAPGAIGHELMRTLRGTSPLYIKPRPDLSLAFWLLRFAANCNRRHLNHAIKARDAILRVSGELFSDLFADEDLACDFEQRGLLMAFTDPATMRGYQKTNRLLEPFGLAATFHDREAIRRLEPALNDRVCGGWHHRADSHLRPEMLMSAWTRAARDRGVRIDEGCRLERFDTRNGAISGCADQHRPFYRRPFHPGRRRLDTGHWSPTGCAHPRPAGQGIQHHHGPSGRLPHMPCYLVERNTVVTPWQSGYRLGGTMEFSGFDDRLNERRLGNLETSAALYLKTPLGRRVTERWTSLRPMSVDDLPIIDRVPQLGNLFIATGHGMLGLSTATGTGRLVADMILGRRPPFDPLPFSIRRFG